MLIKDINTEILSKWDLIQELNTTIKVLIHDGIATLIGTVSSLFEKRLIERAVANISGINNVINSINIINDLKFRLSDISISIFEVNAI